MDLAEIGMVVGIVGAIQAIIGLMLMILGA